MCGIAGFIDRKRSLGEASLRELADRMTRTLRHRGPDGSGVWVDPRAGVALGHRRLAIIDLTPAGAQPMVSACGRFVITYNGEVYNFLELRQDLESRGHAFRGHSDTEVVLAAITEWGIESALQRMNGMFAFGLWDRETQTLTLVRDRAGEKPLYYGWCGGTFLFGSELKALRAHPNFDQEIDRDALGLFIKYSYIPAPYCIFKRIRKLPAGSFLTVKAEGAFHDALPQEYWSARSVAERGEREPFTGTFEEAAEELDSLLRDAVRRRMIADVDLGALLSGGIDSSTVVSLMQAMSARPVKTFSIGFWEPKFNEADHARAIAHHLRTDHTELYVTADDALAVIPELPTIYDEPFADPSQIPTFIVSRLTRRAVKVALSGDGGDELFAGYKRYLRCVADWKVMRWYPLFLRRGAATAISGIRRFAWRMLGARDCPEPDQLPGWRTFGAKAERVAGRLAALSPEDLFARHRNRCQEPAELVMEAGYKSTLLNDPSRWADVSEPIRVMTHMDFADFMCEDILTKVDRASMAVGLEVRCPLLDHRVADFAWRLPMSMCVDREGGKRILRYVLSRYVPRELTARPKMGFGAPVAQWVRGPLRDWADDLLDEKRIREQGLLRPEAVRRVWQQHLTGWQKHDDLLWNLLMFQAWHRSKVSNHQSTCDHPGALAACGPRRP